MARDFLGLFEIVRFITKLEIVNIVTISAVSLIFPSAGHVVEIQVLHFGATTAPCPIEEPTFEELR
jgi:hypothetical protein